MIQGHDRGPLYSPARSLWQWRWLGLAIAAGVSLGFGYWGFYRHFDASSEPRSLWSLFYVSFQLFILESGNIAGPVPWQLNVARFLAPAVAGAAALAAVLLIFRKQVEALLMRRMSGQAIVCGLGEKGSLLVRSLRDVGRSVVVIERDAQNDFIDDARLRGAIVIIGDARDRRLLIQAGAQRAAHLVSVAGSDDVNAEIAIQARDVASGRSQRALTCSAHIVDPRLCLLLRREELASPGTSAFRLEFFNVFESGAQALIRTYPFFESTGLADDDPHIVIVGLGLLGERLVAYAERAWRQVSKEDGSRRLRITIVDEDADAKVESLTLRHPELTAGCDLHPQQMSLESPEFERAVFLDAVGAAGSAGDPTMVYVCLETDTQAVAAALTLHRHLAGSRVPIVVTLARSAGLARLLGKAGDVAGYEHLHPFGLLDRTLSADLILGGMYETLARALHEQYVQEQTDEGRTPAVNPSMASWDELPETLKESNREQAGHIGVKLQAVGCDLVPYLDSAAEGFQFPEIEVERLAEMEHDRWEEERHRDGWKYVPGAKNEERKTSPYMVPWDQLSDEVKEWDRAFVRGLPSLLAGAGFQITRLDRTTKASTIRGHDR